MANAATPHTETKNTNTARHANCPAPMLLSFETPLVFLGELAGAWFGATNSGVSSCGYGSVTLRFLGFFTGDEGRSHESSALPLLCVRVSGGIALSSSLMGGNGRGFAIAANRAVSFSIESCLLDAGIQPLLVLLLRCVRDWC